VREYAIRVEVSGYAASHGRRFPAVVHSYLGVAVGRAYVLPVLTRTTPLVLTHDSEGAKASVIDSRRSDRLSVPNGGGAYACHVWGSQDYIGVAAFA